MQAKLKLENVITKTEMSARDDSVCNVSRHGALPVKNRVKY